MLALYRSGRQAEALDTARALQDRLRDDLGIELAPEVRDLYRRILSERCRCSRREAFAIR
jgi:DNA-binding SARP family transcriptional activator